MSKLSEFELLELTLHESESRLHAVLGAGLKKITGPALLDQHLPMWSPSFFGLEKCSALPNGIRGNTKQYNSAL